MKQKFKLIFKSIFIAGLSSLLFGTLVAESLYPLNARFSNIANRIATQRGDILTVVVSESRSTSNALTTSTSKKAGIANQVTQFLYSSAASGFGTHNTEMPAVDMAGENTYTGGGTQTSTQAMSDKFSVMVTDVLPNGNMVILGARKMKTSDQAEYVTLSGIVRYWDVTAANTISSQLISDLNIQYVSEGTISKAEKKGWLGKINEILNPF